jgi:peptide-methionine (R)-S-oxide reductase
MVGKFIEKRVGWRSFGSAPGITISIQNQIQRGGVNRILTKTRHMKSVLLTCTCIVAVVLMTACNGNTQSKGAAGKPAAKDTSKVANMSDAEWKSVLTSEQYHVLRDKGTDRPFTGKYYLHNDKGVYSCAGCGTQLFTSDMKFDSDCGWPSFDREIAGGKIKQITDTSFGMERIEIVCAKCGGHLGHIFDDGPTLTGKRYCVNSTSIDFTKKK